jgi:hypothetical protein
MIQHSYHQINGRLYLKIIMVLKMVHYNDADSGDINGDGFEDIVIGSTRGSPYYAGRHVQILISNGDGTFVDETSTRFSYQPRSELDTSLIRNRYW